MTKCEYNGWTNYETWCVKLWMDNEQSSQDYWRERTAQCIDNVTHSHSRGELGNFTIEERATLNMADALKEQHEEAFPELEGFVADLLNAAMSEVNWHEIAKSLVESAKTKA